MTSVTAVMNVFKRGQNFENQLSAILNQTYPVTEILIWENGEDSVNIPQGIGIDIVRARSNKNLGVWARFAFALNAKSEFVWLIDDDTIPGSKWLQSAMAEFKKNEGIIGSRGLRFRGRQSYSLYEEFGPNNPSNESYEVDIVGHNWVLPRAWLGAFWAELPNAFLSELAGEDIHLSYSVKKLLGKGTFVPPHPPESKELWGEIQAKGYYDGTDSVAISKSPKSLRRFEDAFRHYVKLGFEPLATTQRTNESLLTRHISDLQGQALYLMPSLIHKIARFLRISKPK